MFEIELVVILLVIYLGIRIGGIGIGFAGGLGVLILTILFHMKPGAIPFNIIEIVMTVVIAIATMQAAGGMNYLLNLTERMLRNHPKHITFLAPLITWSTTIFTGTSYAIFSVLPVIVGIAKKQGIRPSRPLSIAVIASQIAITSSPISAAMIFFANILEPMGISYLTLLAIYIPITFVSVMITAVFCNFLGAELKDDPIYQERLLKGRIETYDKQIFKVKSHSKLSVILFLIGNIAMIIYTAADSSTIGLIQNQVLSRNEIIAVFMLSVSMIISIICRVDTSKILNTNTFKLGMSSCICILGMSWLGDTFIKAHINDIQFATGDLLCKYPYLLTIVLFFTTALLYSQAATVKAIIPIAITLGVNLQTVVASFVAVSALFILPTYPTLLAAVEIDDTGSTRIGKYVLNHVFLMPGIIAVVLCIVFGFIVSSLIL